MDKQIHFFLLFFWA